MKKMLAIALMAMVATGAMAQDKAENSKNNHQGTAHHKHQGPEPLWHLLGLLYFELLRE